MQRLSPEATMIATSHKKQVRFGSHTLRRAMVVLALGTATAGAAIVGLVQINQPTKAAEGAPAVAAARMPTQPAANLLYSELGHFAFGYLEFDWNPAEGVPGFDSWPPGRSQP